MRHQRLQVDITSLLRNIDANIHRETSLIDADSLWKQANGYLEDHWKARDLQLHERSMPPGIDIEIVQERHHAINWITGYDGLPWDEVTTDT
jgi:hypothetical protein